MNRHERRRSEKLRAAKLTKQWSSCRKSIRISQQCSKPQPGVLIIPDDLRADIAASIRSFHMMSDEGGLCMFRTVIGYRFLCHLGIPARIAFGGMVYRVGPHPERDVVSFCGPGNVGQLHPDGGMLGHCWIENGDDVLDFSVGDWRTCCPEDELILGPVQWEIEPPEYFWLPKNSVNAIAGQHIPELGRAYYTGWRGPTPVSTIEEMGEDLDWKHIGSMFTLLCNMHDLTDRVRA
jgi:hypothetical protein